MEHLVYTSEYQWQTDYVQGLLKASHIESITLTQAREYAQIVTGIGQPIIEIYVSSENKEQALKIISQYLKSANLTLVDAENQNEKNYFRTTLFFSLASCFFLPIIFNLIATHSFFKLLKQKQNQKQDKIIVATLVLIGGWIGAIFIAYWFFK